MKNLFVCAIAVVSLAAVSLADGLEVGAPVSAFYVQDVTGPKAGEKLCYRCHYKDRPVVSIFTRNVNGEVATLIKEVDQVVGQNEDQEMAAFVVLLTEEAAENRENLKKVAKEQNVSHTPLTLFEGAAGPPAYKITDDAEVTVMMWVNGTLKVNEAFKSGELTKDKIASVISKTSEILN